MVVGFLGALGAGRNAADVRFRGLRGGCCCRRVAPVRVARDGQVPRIVDESELEDDADYVIVDGKDLNQLLDKLVQSDLDGSWSGEEAEAEAETEAEPEAEGLEYEKEYTAEEERETVKEVLDAYNNRVKDAKEFFTAENMQYMPPWAQRMYREGTWNDFVDESNRATEKEVLPGGRSLDAVAGSPTGNAYGLENLTIQAIADDYRLPIELIMDRLIHMGAKLPLQPADLLRDCVSQSDVQVILEMVTSYDAADLVDLYSDDTVKDIAYDYDVDPDLVVALCADNGIHLCLGENTHLLNEDESILCSMLTDMTRSRRF
mmetsp:Transcript_4481/g.13595  ORF Transcript_4481/g.13595 Transcript_4481/m.13595 type:complete len:318 (-) Transcript_4481:145-1098(-)